MAIVRFGMPIGNTVDGGLIRTVPINHTFCGSLGRTEEFKSPHRNGIRYRESDETGIATASAADGVLHQRTPSVRTIAICDLPRWRSPGVRVLALQYFVAERLPTLTEATLEAATEQWKSTDRQVMTWISRFAGRSQASCTSKFGTEQVTAETRDGRMPPHMDMGHVVGARHVRYARARIWQTAENPEQTIQAAGNQVAVAMRVRSETRDSAKVPSTGNELARKFIGK